MIIIAICDDSIEFREKTRSAVEAYITYKQWMDIEILTFTCGEDLLKYEGKIHLLLLDIEMRDISGIDVKRIYEQKNKTTQILFMTNHEEMIKSAFGKNVIGFLNKEKDNEYTNEFLRKVLKRVIKEHHYIQVEAQGKKINTIYLKDIYYIEASKNSVDIVTTYGTFAQRKTLKTFEEQLEDSYFFRVQKSFLVNLAYMDHIKNQNILLTNGVSISIARGSAETIMEQYLNYLREQV